MNIQDVFDQRYRVVSKLGKGGMSSVYLAITNDRLEKKRAIKEISYNKIAGSDVLHEAFILKDLEHDGIPRIIEIKDIPEENKLYIVQEYVEGISLENMLKNGDQPSDQMIYQWFLKLTDILAYIHKKNIIHRDIKPDNIMLTRDGKIKLIDFGISSDDNNDVKAAYTAKYAAPEQKRKESVQANADIYSLGMTIYKLITGKTLPLDKTNLNFAEKSALDSEKTMPGLVKIVEQCIVINPKKRYASVEKLKKDLDNIHKITRSYKRKVWIRDIKIAFIISIIIAGVFFVKGGQDRIIIENNQAFEEAIKNAYICIDEGDYTAAHKEFEAATEIYPDDVRAVEVEAIVKYYSEGADACIKYVENLGYEYDTSDILNYMAGYAYLDKKEYESSYLNLKDAYTLNPMKENIVRDYAVVCAKCGKVEEAIAAKNHMKEQGFSEVATLYVSGEINVITKQYQEAILDFKSALATVDEEELKARIYIALANLYRDNLTVIDGAELELINTLEEAKVQLVNKDNFVVKEMLGEAYYNYASISTDDEEKAVFYNKAIDSFYELITMGYKRSYIYKNLAILYQKLDDYAGAEKVVEEMIAEYPEEAGGYIQRIWIEIEKQGSVDKTQRNYARVADLYNQLVDTFADVKENAEFKQLNSLIQELVEKKWLLDSDLH